METGTRIYLVGYEGDNSPYGLYYFSTDYKSLQVTPPQLKVACNSMEDAIDELAYMAKSLVPNTYELGKFRLTQREGSVLHIWEVFQHQ